MPICGGARTAAESVSHNFPRTNSAAATETRGGVAGSVTHNFCRTETCVLTETDRDQSMRMSPPRSPLSLSRSPVRSSVRLSAGNRYGQLKTIIAAREPTDRPSEGASDRPSSVACGAAAVIAASEPREGEGGQLPVWLCFLANNTAAPVASFGSSSFPSVRPFDGPSDVRPLRSQCPFARSFVRRAQVRSPLLRTAVRAVTGRSENREEERASRSLLEQKQLIPSPPPRIPRTLHCF